MEGPLPDQNLLHELRRISASGGSGQLAVQGEADLVSLGFKSGHLVGADGMAHTFEESFGRLLAREGVLSPESYRAIVEQATLLGEPLLQVLLASAAIDDPRQVVQVAREQVYQQALRVLRWPEASFTWTAGGAFEATCEGEPLSVSELLGRSVEELDHGPFSGTLPNLENAFERRADHGGKLYVLGRDENVTEPGRWLTPLERRVYQEVDGETPATSLFVVPSADWDLRFALYMLIELGLVRSVGTWSTDEATRTGSGDELLVSLEDILPAISDEELLGGSSGRGSGRSEAVVMTEPVTEAPTVTDSLAMPLVTEAGDELETSAPIVPAGPSALAEVVALWASRALGIGLVALIGATVLQREQRANVEYPFAWLSREKAEFARSQRASAYHKVERGIRTYHLLYGTPPDALGVLNDLDLLSSEDLYDAQGNWISYSATAAGYVLQPVSGNEPLPGSERLGDTQGDVFLSQAVLQEDSRRRRTGIVLLD